jgi:hypothetical protein
MLVKKYFQKSKNYNIGLDVACGTMSMNPYFKTGKYIGIDIDKSRIEQGLKKYNEAEGFVERIEDLNINGDFVVCLQTIGFNKNFNIDNTFLSINKLINATNEKGSLLFNVKSQSAGLTPQIHKKLRKNYEHVEEISYGGLNTKLPRLLSYVVAFFLYLRSKSPYNKLGECTLYYCENKRCND